MLLAPNKTTSASLFTLALLAFPAIGSAADAQAASGPAVRVSAASPQASAGVVALKVQNRTRAKLAGKVSAKVGKTAAGSKAFKVKRRGTAKVRLALSGAAKRKLAADRRLRLSVTAKVKGRRAVSTVVTVTGAAPRTPAPGSAPANGGGSTGGGQGQESPNWVARTGGSGAYDDFAFTLAGGQINVTRPPLAFLLCSENGGAYRSYGSWEPFAPAGPWTLGAQSQELTKVTPLGNLLAGSSERTVRYQLRSSRSGNSISGQLYMSTGWSNYDPYTNRITFVNCFGTTQFDAVQG